MGLQRALFLEEGQRSTLLWLLRPLSAIVLADAVVRSYQHASLSPRWSESAECGCFCGRERHNEEPQSCGLTTLHTINRANCWSYCTGSLRDQGRFRRTIRSHRHSLPRFRFNFAPAVGWAGNTVYRSRITRLHHPEFHITNSIATAPFMPTLRLEVVATIGES